MTFSRFLTGGVLATSLTVALAAPAFADQMPCRENLAQAKQLTVQLQNEIQQILTRAQSGGDYPAPTPTPMPSNCQQIRDPRTCAATRACVWESLSDERHRCVDRPVLRFAPESADTGDVDENDNAAEYALQGLGSGLFELGQLIDQANLAWGTPNFWQPWHQACQKDRQLACGAADGKVSAQLPAIGFITPADFDGIEQEVHAVKDLLLCN